MKIYLTGGWGYGNIGDEAILLAMLASIRASIPNLDLTLTSFNPEETSFHHGIASLPSIHRLLFKRSFLGYPRRWLLRRWLGSKGKGVIPVGSRLRKHLAAIRDADLVVMGGGGYLNDLWKEAFPARLLELSLFHHFKKPVFIYGQTVGPFNTTYSTQHFETYLRPVAFIAYRDEQSKRTLEKYRYPLNKSTLTADEANLIVQKRSAQQVREANGLSVKRKLVGVMAQHFRPYEAIEGTRQFGRISSHDDYIAELARILVDLRGERDVDFVFLPSTAGGARVCRELRTKVQEMLGVELKQFDNLRIADYVALCQSVDVMFTTNMHPAILATTAGIPSVVLSYFYKLDDFMRSIGLAENTHRIDDFARDTVRVNLSEMLEINDSRRSEFLRRRDVVREAAHMNVNRLVEVATTVVGEKRTTGSLPG